MNFYSRRHRERIEARQAPKWLGYAIIIAGLASVVLLVWLFAVAVLV